MSDTPQHAADRPVAAGARADHDARRSFVRRIRRVAVALTLVLVGTFLWGLFGLSAAACGAWPSATIIPC